MCVEVVPGAIGSGKGRPNTSPKYRDFHDARCLTSPSRLAPLAQDRAAEQIIAWVAEHATTRVGPRGRQEQVPVELIGAVTVRHVTSRAGDPHRHLHLQFNARVFADGRWRGLHTVGFRDSIEALNGIGHAAAVMTDPDFRAALTAAAFTLDPSTCEVAELAPYVGRFSERAAQIGRNIDRYEAEWRAANPAQEPGPVVRQSRSPCPGPWLLRSQVG